MLRSRRSEAWGLGSFLLGTCGCTVIGALNSLYCCEYQFGLSCGGATVVSGLSAGHWVGSALLLDLRGKA
jgi:hypothetical protein